MVASPRDQFSQLSQYGDREGTVVGGLAGQWVCLKLSQLSVWPLDLFSSDFKFFHSLPNRWIIILLLSTITYSFLLLPFWPNLTFSCCLSSRLVFLTVFTFLAPSFPPSFLSSHSLFYSVPFTLLFSQSSSVFRRSSSESAWKETTTEKGENWEEKKTHSRSVDSFLLTANTAGNHSLFRTLARFLPP